MKQFDKAIVCVVALLSSMVFSSCINEEYELSKDNIDLNITVFQEGVSIPLGSTEQITLETFYSDLGDDLKSMLQELEGAYIFRMSDSMDMTEDIASALSGINALDAVAMNKDFMFSLNNIDVSGLAIEGRTIGPETIDISEMLAKLDIQEINNNLPSVSKEIPTIRVAVPEPEADDLVIDFDSVADDLANETVIAKLGSAINLSGSILDHELANTEMDYLALASAFPALSLPDLITSFVFDPYTVEVPVEFSLPSGIKSVKDIVLNKDASFELSFEIENSLFTSGSIAPELDIDLHHLLNIDYVKSGLEGSGLDLVDPDGDGVFEQHVKDKFVMSAQNGWKSSHVYHVESLAIDEDDWMSEDGKLVLNKNIPLTLSGELVVDKDGLKTTLRHLAEYGNSPMKIKMELNFIDFSIEDVKVEIDPVVKSETVEMPIEIDEIDLGTDLVKKVDYIEFDQESPLYLNMSASLPQACKSLELNLKTLKIEFPEGMVISSQGSAGKYDEASRTLVYENVSLTEGLNEQIVIEKMNLPELVDNKLSYSGAVKVVAEAEAAGILSTKDLIEGETGDIVIDASVAFEPKVVDYAVTINDYTYDVEFDPIEIYEKLSAELGEMLAEKSILVSLEKDALGQNPTVSIRLDYPHHPAIKILPKVGDGLTIDFPDMLRFSPSSIKDSYNFDTRNNTMRFKGNDPIPTDITLVIDNIEVKAQKEGDNYVVSDRMLVMGGVRLAGTTIHKGDVDYLQKNAVVSFEGNIPDIRPAEFGLDEFEKVISSEFEVAKIEVDVPEMISSLEIEQLLLKDVYLDLSVDAASVKEIVGDVDMTLALEVDLPDMILVESTDENVKVSENNVVQINASLPESGVITVDGVHVVGFDLSEVEIKDGKISLEVGKIPVTGTVLLKNLKVDVESLKDVDLELHVSGGLASRDEKGLPTESILIEKINGYVGLDIDPVELCVDLSPVVEALDSDKMAITPDLNTFYLTLDVNTNVDVPLYGNLEITPYYGDAAGEKVDKPISLDPQQRKDDHYLIFVSNMAPAEGGRYDIYKDYQYIDLDLISMLYKKNQDGRTMVADSIQVALNAGVDSKKLSTLEPTKDYVLSAEYEVGVPLELGEEFSFEYRDTLSGLPELVNQLLAYGSVGLGGKVTSSLPLRLDLQVNLLDSLDRVIPMKEEAGKLKIASCDAKGNPVTTDLNLVIGVDGTVESGLKSVELIFKADAKDAAGIPVGPGCFMQVELNAMIPDGISIDGWELLEKMDEEQN